MRATLLKSFIQFIFITCATTYSLDLMAQKFPGSEHCTIPRLKCPSFLNPSLVNLRLLQEEKTYHMGLSTVESFNTNFDFYSANNFGGSFIFAYSPIKGLGISLDLISLQSSSKRSVKGDLLEVIGGGGFGEIGWPVYEYTRWKYKSKSTSVNLGTGYYKNLGSNFFIESYLKLGIGKFEIQPDVSNSNFSSIFTEANISSTISWNLKSLDFGLSYQVSTIKFRKINNGISHQEHEFVNREFEIHEDYLNDRTRHFLSQYSATVNLNIKKTRFQVQIAKTWNHSNPTLRMHNFLVSLGVFHTVGSKK